MESSQGSRSKSWPGEIPLRSEYTAGKAGQVFLAALKEGRLLASGCKQCEQTYFPARLFCERCFSELSADVEIKPRGKLVSFTLCYLDRDRTPLAEPMVLALVQLDGATTVFLHRLLDVREPAQVQIGVPVQLIFAPPNQRSGAILDIEGFRIISP